MTVPAEPAASVPTTAATPDPAVPPPADPAAAAPKPVDPPAAAATPVVYSLKLPEGSYLKPADVEKIQTLAKEKGWSNDQAQEHLSVRSDAYKDAYASMVTEQNEQLNKTSDEWIQQLRSDKTIGGEKFQENMELAKRVVARFNPALVKPLEDTKLGNHPELVKLLVAMAPHFSNDKMIHPGVQAAGKLSREEIFYGPDANK